MKISDVLKSTRLTEKSYQGIGENKYVFGVDLHASKFDIKNAVEALYNIEVIAVNTLVYRGKKKRRGNARKMVKIGKIKKAIVQVKAGQTISTFDEIFATDNKK